MPKIQRRGTDLMEREVQIHDMTDAKEAEVFAAAFASAKSPASSREEFADSMREILKRSDFAFDARLNIFHIPHDCREDSAEFIAHHWLQAYSRAEACRHEIESGNETLYSWPAMTDAFEDMGQLRERFWWRCIRVKGPGRPAEKLAIIEREADSGRRKGGALIKKNSEVNRQMTISIAEDIKRGLQKPVSVSHLARKVAEQWGDGAPKHSTLRGYLAKIAAEG